jgi:hypothetical protein
MQHGHAHITEPAASFFASGTDAYLLSVFAYFDSCCRLGATRLNVYAGLAGFFMLRDFFPDTQPELPGLPYPPPGKGPDSAVRELLLAVQDRAFDVNNQL